MTVYPIFLNNLDGRRCVVFGGGHEGERKVIELLDCRAEVVVVSETVTPNLQRLAAEGRFSWLRRRYEAGDLHGAFLAIVAETNPAATAPIWDEAQAERVLLNAMDDVPHCTFVAGSVIRRGPIVVSISTSGCAPSLSVRLRQRLEKIITRPHGTFAEWMGALREPMARAYPDFNDRKRHWYDLVDSDVLALIEDGDFEAARERMKSIVGDSAARHLPAVT